MSASAEKELVVTRTPENGANREVSVTFSPAAFLKGAKKDAGLKYPAFPTISKDTLQDAIDFLGWDDFLALVNDEFRLWSQQTYNAVIDATKGEFDEKMFIDFFSKLSTRGETKEEIETALAGLRAKMIALMDAAEATTDEAEKAKLYMQFGPLTKEVKKYDAILESKKRVRKPKVEGDEEDAKVA